MMDRLKFHSDAITEKFPGPYTEICSKSPIVISCPLTFSWFGETSGFAGFPTVMSRLPVRLWVGLEPVSTTGVVLLDYIEYSVQKQKFNPPTVIDEPGKTRVQRFVEKYLAENLPKGKIPGLRVNIIIESKGGVGHNGSAAMSANLAVAVLLYCEKITPEQVKSWESVSLPELIKNGKQNGFDQAFRLGWKMAAIYHDGHSTGSAVFNSLVSSDEPVVFCSPKRNFANHSHGVPVNFSGNLELIDKLNYAGWRLSELVGVNTDTVSWPIDFVLVTTGQARAEASAIKATFATREQYESLAKRSRGWFEDNLGGQTEPDFLEIFHGRNSSFWEHMMVMLGINTLEGIDAFADLMILGSSEISLRRFAKTISTHHQLLRIIGASSRVLDRLRNAFRDATYKAGYELETSAKLIGSGHGGDLLVVTQVGRARELMMKVVKEQRAKLSNEIGISYISWLDGLGKIGIRVEQSLFHKQYSKFVSKHSLQIAHLNRDGIYHHDLYTLEEFHREFPKMDLVCDLRDHKIYLRGEQIQSDELHSAKVSCDILNLLMKQPSKYVPKDELSVGSYAEDRNTMQSKIVSPLNKLVGLHLKAKNFVKIHGGLSDFSLQLTPGEVDCYIIERSL